ncbi:MAG: hypothetical protein ACYSUS_05445, partial [Planctomycetota bacterium]
CPYKKQPPNHGHSVLSDTRFIQGFGCVLIDFFARSCYHKIIKHGFGGRDKRSKKAVMKSNNLVL